MPKEPLYPEAGELTSRLRTEYTSLILHAEKIAPDNPTVQKARAILDKITPSNERESLIQIEALEDKLKAIARRSREPLYPHRPKKREPLFPHVPRGRQTLLPQTKGITPEEWQFAQGMWESTKQLVEEKDPYGIHIWRMLEHFYPGDKSKQVSTLGFMNDIYGRYGRGPIPHEELIKSAKKWGVEKMLVKEMLEFLPQTINLLAKTEGEPITKFCCRFSDACAPPELLEEGKFPERIAWLRKHYKEKHPGMWGKGS